MKFEIHSIARPKRVAKSLKKALRARGHDLPLSRCQNAVAVMYGHDDWHALANSVGRTSSAGDADVAHDVAAARRVTQIAAIVELGVPISAAEDVVDEIQPTGRGRVGQSDRLAYPRMLVRYHHEDAPETVATIDLTDHVINRVGNGGGFRRVDIELTDGRTPHWFPQATRTPEGAWRAYHFDMASVLEQWNALKEYVGTDSAQWRSLYEHHSRVLTVLGRLNGAKKDLAAVRDARFVPFHKAREKFKMFVCVGGFYYSSEFSHDLEGIYEGSMHDVYYREVESAPIGQALYAGPGGWRERANAWAAEWRPPFAWGTMPDHWSGLSAEWVRDAVFRDEDDDGNLGPPSMEETAEDLVQCDLGDNHHEDAIDLVVDWDDLDFVETEWLPHAGSGDEIDLSLEPRLAAWNAKQTVVSYYHTHSVIVGADPEATKATSVAWCERRITSLQEWLDNAEWVRPAPQVTPSP